MNLVSTYLRELRTDAAQGWNRFWFTPARATTLGLIRVLAGAMLLYTHLVWSLELEAFFGPHAWISAEAASAMYAPVGPDGTAPVSFAWSYFWLINSPTMLWAVHIAALVVFALLMLGWRTRVISILAALAAISYVNRVPGALFGLDQINVMLATYLAVGRSGDAFSVDAWLRRRRGLPEPAPAVSTNVATRLIQLHMCIIYLFAGMSKLMGPPWWNGEAMWLAVANLEYQSLDLTWFARYPVFVAILTHTTVWWELSFSALVWPRLTRPIVLALAIPLHLGIALGLGMMTFGLVMLIGCMAFIPPIVIESILGRAGQGIGPGQGRGEAAETTDAASRKRARRSTQASRR